MNAALPQNQEVPLMETARYPIVRPLDLKAITLGRGIHPATDRPGNGDLCLLEAAAYMAGEDWTDHPKCVSPVLGTYGRQLNDLLPDDQRQQLRQYIPAMLGTAGDGLDEARSYLALDWLIRTCTPAWLDLAGLIADATALRDLRQITDMVAATEAGSVMREVRVKATDAVDAAWEVAGDAWEAAGDAWDIARDAARDAWYVVGAAAWDASGAAVAAARAAAQVAAQAASVAAAQDATVTAAQAASVAAAQDVAKGFSEDAAWDAARDKLMSTVGILQQSAIALFVAMLRPTSMH